jgi:hypothetical protein
MAFVEKQIKQQRKGAGRKKKRGTKCLKNQEKI